MNEQTETMEQPMAQPVKVNDVLAVAPYHETRSTMTITPQAGCATCGGSEGATGLSPNGSGVVSYVYAIGRVEARFPNLAAEKEFAQGRPDGQTPPGKPISRPSMPFCPDARTAT